MYNTLSNQIRTASEVYPYRLRSAQNEQKISKQVNKCWAAQGEQVRQCRYLRAYLNEIYWNA